MLPIGCVSKGRQGKELAELGDLADAGVVAFSDDGSPVADAALMRKALEYCRALGLPISDHCEEPSLTQDGVMHEGLGGGPPGAARAARRRRGVAGGARHRPGGADRLAACTSPTSARGAASSSCAQAKARGVPVTAEVTPHHLTLTHESVMSSPSLPDELAYDTNAKVYPPLRTADDVAACVEGLRDGTIDAIATDHAPHAPVDKLCEFDDAPSGISGFETALALVLSLVHEGKLDLPTLIEKHDGGAGRGARAGPPRGARGAGQPGRRRARRRDVFDPNAEWTVDAGALRQQGAEHAAGGSRAQGAGGRDDQRADAIRCSRRDEVTGLSVATRRFWCWRTAVYEGEPFGAPWSPPTARSSSTRAWPATRRCSPTPRSPARSWS